MDTYGYDVAFARTTAAANAALAAWFSSSPPVRLDYSGSDTADNATITLTAVSGPWQIVPGGSNQLLRFSIPIASGSLLVEAPNFHEQTPQLQGVSVTVEIQLGWIDHAAGGAAQPSGTGSASSLVLNMGARATGVGDAAPGAVATISVDDPAGVLSPVASAVLEEVFADVLIAHRADVSQVFATIVPPPQGTDAWLTPTAWDYYYQEPEQGPAVLCVLITLAGRAQPTTPSFDPTVLATAADTYVVVSELQFLQNAMLPALPAAFGGGTFALQPSGPTTATIVNQGSIPTKTTSWGADTYSPHIDGYSLSIDGSNLVTSVQGGCDITGLAGASVSFSGTKTASTSYDPTTGALSAATPTGQIDSSKHIPWYDWVFGVLSGGVGIAIIDGVIAAVTDTITTSVGSAVSATVDASITSTVLTVCDWAGPSTKPVAGGLSGALWLAASSTSD